MADEPTNNEGHEAGGKPLRPYVYAMSEQAKRQHENAEWSRDAPEVQQHRGKFVAVRDKRVIAVGTDSLAVVTEAARIENCLPEEIYLTLVQQPELWLTQDINDYREEFTDRH